MITPSDKQTQPALQPPELLPCPFCPHGYGFVRNESGRYFGICWVECDWKADSGLDPVKDVAPCGARTAEYNTVEEAITAWNTRTRVVDGVVATEVLNVLAGRHHAANHKQFDRETCPAWPCDILRTAVTAPIAASVKESNPDREIDKSS